MSSRIGIMLYNIWAATCDFQQCGSFEGEDSEQPPYPYCNQKLKF